MVQISRETLAQHCGRSVRTVSRLVGKLKHFSLIEAAQPSPQGFDCWEPNVYRLTALGCHVAALFGSGSVSPATTACATDGVLVFPQSDPTYSGEKTTATDMAHAEKSKEIFIPPPSPIFSCGQELEPVIQALEKANPKRFANLRDWVSAKLRIHASRSLLRQALEELQPKLGYVQGWAGWVQSRLEDLEKAEKDAERKRQAILRQQIEDRQAWQKRKEEREQNQLTGGDLMAMTRRAKRGELL